MMDEIQYLHAIISPLLRSDHKIEIDRKDDEKGVLLTVTNLAQNDMGTLIGRGGLTATSIRNVMRVFAGLRKMHISVKFEEPALEARESN